MKRKAGHQDTGLRRRVGADDARRSTRRRFLIALGASALAVPPLSFAQQPARVPRVGFLIAETAAGQANRIEALRGGLRDLGYIEGKTITMELRLADGNYDRLPALAAELVQLKVDVLVAFGAKAVLAAKGATTTIPIVVPVVGNPVGSGLVSSLARPGGNITGSTVMSLEIASKRVELFKEAVPRIARVAYLMNPANPSFQLTFEAISATAKALKLKLELRPFRARTPKEIGTAFSAMAKERVDAIMVAQDTLFIASSREIADRAAKQRMPSAGTAEFAEAGGLIGYGASDAEMYRRGAYFVDRILKGAKPADLPIEQPTRFELVLNMKTAHALGIKIPDAIMLRASKVIE